MEELARLQDEEEEREERERQEFEAKLAKEQ